MKITAHAFGRDIDCEFRREIMLCKAGPVSKAIPVDVHYADGDREDRKQAQSVCSAINLAGWQARLCPVRSTEPDLSILSERTSS